ncbi:MAG: AI-2E family transporter [Chloroflexi bacterium]|nr:MAG: AI-2E family transporter [Chloroflexota bacterium]
MMPADRAHRARQYRTLLVIGAVLAIAWLLWSARSALLPFVIGLVVAYLLVPIVNKVESVIPNRRPYTRFRREFSILSVYLVFIAVLVAAGMTIVPRLITESTELIDSLPSYWEEITSDDGYWHDKYEALPLELRNWIEDNIEVIQEWIAAAASTALERTFTTLRQVLGFVIGLLLLPLWLYYVLKDDRRAMTFVYSIWPEHLQADIREIVRIIDRVLSAYVRGQIFLGFVVGIVTWIGLTVIGVSQPAALAIIAGIFELLPILGPWLSFVVAAIVVLATDPGQIVAVAILFLMVQQLENTFLVPRIQGNAVNMNPAIIMVLLVVGGAVFGLVGAVAIVPVAAIVRDVWIYVYRRLSEVSAELDQPAVGAVASGMTSDE